MTADFGCPGMYQSAQTANVSVPAQCRLAVISVGGTRGAAALSQAANMLNPTTFCLVPLLHCLAQAIYFNLHIIIILL